jgi:hypothetical protein
MGVIKKLTQQNLVNEGNEGKDIYPVTHAKAVYVDLSEEERDTLQNLIDEDIVFKDNLQGELNNVIKKTKNIIGDYIFVTNSKGAGDYLAGWMTQLGTVLTELSKTKKALNEKVNITDGIVDNTIVNYTIGALNVSNKLSIVITDLYNILSDLAQKVSKLEGTTPKE